MKLIIVFALMFAQNAMAEDIFYIEKARIGGVDCAKHEVTLAGELHQKFDIRSVFNLRPEAPAVVCQSLQSFVGKKPVTLLVTGLKKSDDYISKSEVVGFVDGDYIVAAWDYHSVNKVFKDRCGNYTRDTEICLWAADNNAQYVSFNSFSGGFAIFSAQYALDGSLIFVNGMGIPNRHDKIVFAKTSGKDEITGQLFSEGVTDYPPFKLHPVQR